VRCSKLPSESPQRWANAHNGRMFHKSPFRAGGTRTHSLMQARNGDTIRRPVLRPNARDSRHHSRGHRRRGRRGYVYSAAAIPPPSLPLGRDRPNDCRANRGYGTAHLCQAASGKNSAALSASPASPIQASEMGAFASRRAGFVIHYLGVDSRLGALPDDIDALKVATPGVVIRRRHTSSPRTMASKRRCRTMICSRSARTSSNLVACSTVKSPGLAPFRILSRRSRRGASSQESSPHRTSDPVR
jgi:hypothetical protein